MSEVSESELQSDIIYLQCCIVILAEKTSIVSSYQDSEDDKVKIARSKVRRLLKQMKQDYEKSGSTCRITLDDIKDASLTLTEDLAQNYDDVRVGASFLKFVFYAVKDLVQYLDKALHRAYAFVPEKLRKQELSNEPIFTEAAFRVSTGRKDI